MSTAITKKEIESTLADRFGHVFEQYERVPAETLSTGINEVDNAFQGFPRGAITEIHGTASSGRTSLVLSALADATSREESCALIDCNDTFDLSSAEKAGIDFERLLWVRCTHHLEHAFKAVDLILHSGGFGFVILNLCDVPSYVLRKVVSSWWFRFRRAIEATPTVLIVLTPTSAVRSCAALALAVKNKGAVWPSALSLVSYNRCVNLTGPDQVGSHLSLVAPVIQIQFGKVLSHSQFIRASSISVQCDRPAQWQVPSVKFSPQLR